MSTQPPSRFQVAYEDERRRMDAARVEARARAQAIEDKVRADRAAIPSLEKRVLERFDVAKAVDQRVKVRSDRKPAHERRHSLHVGARTSLTFRVEYDPSRPPLVQAIVKSGAGKASSPTVIASGTPEEFSVDRIDELLEGWIRLVARL